LLNIPTSNLKIKTQVQREAAWLRELMDMEEASEGAGLSKSTVCLNAADEEKRHNNEDQELQTVFFINLEKSTKRREDMEKRLNASNGGKKKYHFERWVASSRKEANVGNMSKYSHRGQNKNQFVGKGTIATYLSHVKLMDHISKLKDGVYMILEDDAQPKFDLWADEAMCQIKELPKDWDVYKFGFFGGGGSCQGESSNASPFSCALKKHSYAYMGNQGYAVTPKGAKKMLEHLWDMPVYDVDGAMMSGQAWGGKGSAIDANYFVAKHTMLRHDQSYGSVRVHENGGQFLQCDKEAKKKMCEEEEEQNNDEEDGRESSFAAKQRLARSFLRTGRMPWEVQDKTLTKDWSKYAALV